MPDTVYLEDDPYTIHVTVEEPGIWEFEGPPEEEGPYYDPNWSSLPEGPMGPPSSLQNTPWWFWLLLAAGGYYLLKGK